MTTRLVLGYGSLAQALVDALAGRPDDLVVVTDHAGVVRTLREEGIEAETGDITADDTLADLSTPASIVVASDSPARNEAATRAARRVYPDAFLLAYTGEDPPPTLASTLGTVADDVVDPLAESVTGVLDRAGDESLRVRKLLKTLRSLDGPLAIVTHNNPDPDAIASAVALERIAVGAGCATDICYFGEISHQENRAFVNLLEFDLLNLESGADLSAYGGVALVDHSRAGVNNDLPPDTPIDVVIDHHPPRTPVDARFVDLRSEVGATSTLLVDYLQRLGVTPDEETATGLLFGIRVDTDEFTREASPDDFAAAGFLMPHADFGTLERIGTPSMSPETLDTIARAITNRRRHGGAVVSGVGELSDRDALAQAADRLLDLEDVTTTFVYGIADGTVYVSARARGTDLDLGETLRDAFGQIGSAGGHADMAGAQLSLGLLETIDAGDESLSDVVDSIVSERFLEEYDSRTRQVLTDVYPDEFHGLGLPGDADPLPSEEFLGQMDSENWADRGSPDDDEPESDGSESAGDDPEFGGDERDGDETDGDESGSEGADDDSHQST